MRNDNSALKLILATILTLAGGAYYLYARQHELDTSGLALFLLPVISALFTSANVAPKLDKLNDDVAEVRSNVNGHLTRALSAAGLPPTQANGDAIDSQSVSEQTTGMNRRASDDQS